MDGSPQENAACLTSWINYINKELIEIVRDRASEFCLCSLVALQRQQVYSFRCVPDAMSYQVVKQPFMEVAFSRDTDVTYMRQCHYSGLALEACCISEVLSSKAEPSSGARHQWKHAVAAASLAGFLQQSEGLQAVQQLLGQTAGQASVRGSQWKVPVLDALSAYKVSSALSSMTLQNF